MLLPLARHQCDHCQLQVLCILHLLAQAVNCDQMVLLYKQCWLQISSTQLWHSCCHLLYKQLLESNSCLLVTEAVYEIGHCSFEPGLQTSCTQTSQFALI